MYYDDIIVAAFYNSYDTHVSLMPHSEAAVFVCLCTTEHRHLSHSSVRYVRQVFKIIVKCSTQLQ